MYKIKFVLKLKQKKDFNHKLKDKEEMERIKKLELDKKKYSYYFKPVDLTDNTIKLITKWRKKHQYSFGSNFKITTESSRNWINQIINDSNRHLYIIIVNGHPIGNIGFKNYNKVKKSIEVDNVLKGEKMYPGIMEKILKKFLLEIQKNMKVSIIWLRVFSDNYKAMNLYERVGMRMIGNIPLKRINTKEGYIWKETKRIKKHEVAERYYSQMQYLKK